MVSFAEPLKQTRKKSMNSLSEFKLRNPKAVKNSKLIAKIIGIFVLASLIIYGINKLGDALKNNEKEIKKSKVNSLLLTYNNNTESYQEIYSAIRNLSNVMQHSVLCVFIKKNKNNIIEPLKQMIETFVTQDCKSSNDLKVAWTKLKEQQMFQNTIQQFAKENGNVDTAEMNTILNEIETALYRLIDALYAIACDPTQSERNKKEILLELSETIIDSFCMV